MVAATGTNPSLGGRWADFAAAVTWLALGLLAAAVVARDDSLFGLGRLLGAASVLLAIVLGAAHRRMPVLQRRPGWRWGSVALQSVFALVAVYCLRELTFAVFLIIIAGCVAEEGERSTYAWLMSVNIPFAAIAGGHHGLVQAAISVPLFLGFQLFSVAMFRAVASERRTREEFAGVNAELLATRRLLQDSARSQERLRISRELHDVAGHRLTALKLNLRGLRAVDEPDPERADLCYSLADELLQDIRSVVHQLRDGDEVDVPGALALLRDQHPDLEVELDVDPDLRVEEIEVAEAIVRSTQEAITNALKHGRARRVEISLTRGEQGLALVVRDDGRGGALAGTGHGLEGMAERARLLGGVLQVDPSTHRGWTLRLTLPAGAAT